MITVSGCLGLSASVARSHGAECQWLRQAAGGGACILLTPFRRTRMCEGREDEASAGGSQITRDCEARRRRGNARGAIAARRVCVETGAVYGRDAAGAANEAGVLWWWQWSSSGCVCMQRTEGEGRVGGRCVTMRRCLQQVCSSSSRAGHGRGGRDLKEVHQAGR